MSRTTLSPPRATPPPPPSPPSPRMIKEGVVPDKSNYASKKA